MQVVLHASSGTTSQIHTDVEPVGAINLVYSLLDTLREAHHLCCLFRRTFREVRDVLIRTHHHMATRIREQIKDDKIEFSPEKD